MHYFLGQLRWQLVERFFPGLTSFPWTVVEATLLALLALMVCLRPANAHTAYRRLARWFQPLCARPVLTVALMVSAVIALHLGFAWERPLPEPLAHDEFSYLLAADTFLHGRLANPTHPLSIFFEAAHVNQTPAYASIYPPGQGLILAAGAALFGHPIIGQWLTAAALTALIYWALTGYLPSNWALLGAVLCAMRIAVFSCWANSYYRGALPAVGGALVIGALAHLRGKRGAWTAAALALGLLILANTRPFEGSMLALGAFIVLVKDFKNRGEVWPTLKRIALPFLLVFVTGALATAYYNFRVTGNPFVFGYQLNMTKAGLAIFPWQSTAGHVFPQAILRNFYDSQHSMFLHAQTPQGFLSKVI